MSTGLPSNTRISLFIGFVLCLVAIGMVLASTGLGEADPNTKLGVSLFATLGIVLTWAILSETYPVFSSDVVVPVSAGWTSLILPTLTMTLWPGSLASTIAFWIVIVSWTTIATFSAVHKILDWSDFLHFTMVGWSVSSLIVTIGRFEALVPYSVVPINKLRGVHALLDIRLTLGVVTTLLIGITGVINALQRDSPRIPSIPNFSISEEPNGKSTTIFLASFLTVLNVIFSLAHSAASVLWIAIARSALFLVLVGEESGKIVGSFLSDVVRLRAAARIIAIFFITIVACVTCRSLSSVALAYIVTESWVSSISSFMGILMRTSLLVLLIASISWLREKSDPRNRAVAALGLLTAGLLLSGLCLLGLGRIESLGVHGFRVPGPFLISAMAFVCIGLLAILTRKARHPDHSEAKSS